LLIPGIRFDDLVTTLEYYTRPQKQSGAMEPNMKLLIEELMKEVCGEIQSLQKEMKDGFSKIARTWGCRQQPDLATVAEQHKERVVVLESVATEFDKTLLAWKLEVKSSLSSVRL
jgi:hypothetical protein